MQRNIGQGPVPVTQGRVYTHDEKMRVVTGIITCILLAALDQTVVLPAIPQMASSLGGGRHLSWVVSAYLLTATATTPIYGKLSDQLGRRAILVPALAVFLLASVVCAMAGSVPMLIAGRALQGVGGGALMSVSQAAVADVIPPRERGKYQGWFAGTWAFASLAGPILGGLVVQHLSWRWIFWGNLPVGGVAMVLCVRGLAGLAPSGRRTRIDYAGAALLLAGVSAVLFALGSGGVDFAWVSLPALALVGLSLAAFALLWRQQRRAAEPLFPAILLANAGLRCIVGISFLNAGAMFAAIFLLPLLLQWVFHVSPAVAGLEIAPMLCTTTIGAFVAGQIAKHTAQPRPIMLFGIASSAASFLLLAVLPLARSPDIAVGVSALFGFGIGTVMPTSLVAAQNQAGGRNVGAATGMLLLMRALGGAFGVTIAGALLALSPNLIEGFRLGFLVCAAMLGGAVVIAARMENFTLRGTLEAPTAAE